MKLSVLLLCLSFVVVGFASSASSSQNCTELGCKDCVKDDSCFWCFVAKKDGECASWEMAEETNCTTYCSGEDCECEVDWLYPSSKSIGGNIILMILYGIVLAFGAKLIADGSEMLLVILNPGIVGGFVLPVLGAVPDAAIIVFSALGKTTEEAQDTIAVGMGTLAGSTIMLLTISFGLSMILARCRIGEDGKQIDKKCKGCNPFKQGITWEYDVPVNAAISMVTSFSYFILQGIAFYYLFQRLGSGGADETNVELERWMAFGGFFICFFFFVCFSIYQVFNTRLQKKRIVAAQAKQSKTDVIAKIRDLVSRTQAKAEITKLKKEDPDAYKKNMASKYGLMWLKFVREKRKRIAETTPLIKKEEGEEIVVEEKKEEKEEKEEDEYDGWPKWKVLLKSVLFMGCGAGLVTFFSDPMVDAVSAMGLELGDLIGLGGGLGFYVSFIITPFCSNASELIASLIFASKKVMKNNTVAFAQLYGAAIMNNTLCLGIFYVLVFSYGLKWSFSAETLTIFIAVMFMGVVGIITFCTKYTMRCWWVFIIFAVYPCSIALVAILEFALGWD